MKPNERIAFVRKEMCFTRRQFSRLLGVSEATLERRERGVSEITLSDMFALEQFGVNPLFIIGKSDTPFLADPDSARGKAYKVAVRAA